MMKKTYSGWIGEDDYGFLCLKEEQNDHVHCDPLAEHIKNDWKTGVKASVRYFVSDQPIDETEAAKALINKLYGGGFTIDYELDAYSEWTVLEWREDLQIGGHNLVSELRSHDGKFCLLVVESA